ncbi:MAG: outer membrane beta-barrel protein [Acidobacteriota bacterium]
MKKLIVLAALTTLGAWPATARAQGRAEIQGFGGVTVGTSTFGSAVSPTFGGRVGVDLTPNLQVIGEAGRLADIESPLFDLLQFTQIGVNVSAYYGEGGVRFITSPHSGVRPYGEATAGFARVNAGVSGLGGNTDPIVNAALNLINTTRPVLGVGGGVVLQGGPISVDLGYRYKKISAGNTIASLLNGGKDYQVNQVRVGVGFRF